MEKQERKRDVSLGKRGLVGTKGAPPPQKEQLSASYALEKSKLGSGWRAVE